MGQRVACVGMSPATARAQSGTGREQAELGPERQAEKPKTKHNRKQGVAECFCMGEVTCLKKSFCGFMEMTF